MEREEFAKRLMEIEIQEGTNLDVINSKVLPISDALVRLMPQSLYRYRACNERQIDAFEKDRIYAVTSDLFNDPYDTLVRYDINSIKEYTNALLTTKTLNGLKQYLKQGNGFPETIKSSFPEEKLEEIKEQIVGSDFEALNESIEIYKKQMLQLIDFMYPLLAEVGKRFVTIACFCESVKSITMWSHYADSHKGFALEYRMRPTLSKGIKKGVGLYPVIYEDERYDASQYMAWAFMKMMGVNVPNPDVMSHVKCALHKSKEWEYEKEWRLVDYSPRNYLTEKVTSVKYKPVAIYYGVNLTPDNKERLHEIAKKKRIAEFEMYIDDKSYSYTVKFRKYLE